MNYLIVGWEFNNTWKVCEVLKELSDEVGFLVADSLEDGKVFDDLNEANEIKDQLNDSHSDINWYVLINRSTALPTAHKEDEGVKSRAFLPSFTSLFSLDGEDFKRFAGQMSPSAFCRINT